MRVRVLLGEPLKTIAGRGKISLEVEPLAPGEDVSLATLLAVLTQNYPGLSAFLPGRGTGLKAEFCLNGRLVREEDVRGIPLAEGDEVLLLLPVAGG